MSTAKCEICLQVVAKYKCPRCCLRTCSVDCVKEHKSKSGCDGVRDKTKFVSVKEMGDLHLLNDYRFLEDIDRKVDGTNRDPVKVSHRPHYIKKLIAQARKRGVTLKVMPQGSTRRRQNSTCFAFQAGTIFWHVEWIFPNCDVKHHSRRVKETATIDTLLDSFLKPEIADPVLRHRLKPYTQLDRGGMRVFMKLEEQRADRPRFRLFDFSRSLADNLHGTTVIEFPTLYVVFGKLVKNYPVQRKDGPEQTEGTESKNCEEELDLNDTETEMRLTESCEGRQSGSVEKTSDACEADSLVVTCSDTLHNGHDRRCMTEFGSTAVGDG